MPNDRSPAATARIARLLLRTWRRFLAGRIPLVAAGAAFFLILALFPGFASVVSLFGLFSDRGLLADEIYRLSAFLPRGAIITLNAELERLIARPEQAGITFLASSLIALWSASSGVRAVLEGLDVAYEVGEDRPLLKLLATSILLTLLGAVSVAISLNIAVILPLIFAGVPYRGLLAQFLPMLTWPAAFGFGMLVLSIVYRYGPNRPRRGWRCFSWGAAVASMAWLGGTALFKLYVGYFDSFNRVYGSLGAVIGFMVWIWITLVILLFGAGLNREIERDSE